MSVIQFEDGTKVNFDGTPTPKDIEEVAKQLQARKQTTPTVTEPKEGFIKGLAKELTSPVASTLANLTKAGQSVMNIGTLLKEGPSGDWQSKVKPVDMQAPVNLPFWGETKPVGTTGDFGKDVKQSLGLGLQYSSFIPAGRAASIAGKTGMGLGTKWISPLAKEGFVGGAEWGAGKALKEDKSLTEALTRGAIEGIAGAATGGMFGLGGRVLTETVRKASPLLGGKVRARVLTSEIVDATNKALSPSGKVSGGALKSLQNKYTDAMQVLGTQGKQIDVVDEDGLIKKFNPSEATYSETLQALVKLKEGYYKTYSTIAQEIGDTGAKIDLGDVTKHLKGVATGPRMAEVKNRAAQLLDEVNQLPNDPQSIMTYLQDLNNGLASKILGRSESASRGVDLEVAKALSGKLDDLMKAANKPQYKEARRAYSALKSVEDDLVKSARQHARKMGGGLSDYVDAFAIPEILVGIVTQQPGQVLSGTARTGMAALLRVGRNRERALQKALEKGAKLNQVMKRLTP